MDYDVFNGDADGILSLLQLRQVEPRDSQLITGIKRDISLVKDVDCTRLNYDSSVTVLDISMEKNLPALNSVLHTGARVFYADHHRSGEIPCADNLESHIDLSADTCTALIVDRLLGGKRHLWAITAAYGDNLIQVGDELAKRAGLSPLESSQLKELGTLINYNGYGAHTDDLAYHPAALYRALLQYDSPFDCVADLASPYFELRKAFAADFKLAESANILAESDICYAVLLEDAPWSRRISGTYGNHLANLAPNRAHIVVTTVDEEHYLISLRAPLNKKTGAGEICAQFETGGGRAGAAGINKLPKAQLQSLLSKVTDYYSNSQV